MSKTNQQFVSQPPKDKKEDNMNMDMFYNFRIFSLTFFPFNPFFYYLVLDDDRKIERPISAPPPGLSSNDMVVFYKQKKYFI